MRLRLLRFARNDEDLYKVFFKSYGSIVIY
jgi:hypothetical protein